MKDTCKVQTLRINNDITRKFIRYLIVGGFAAFIDITTFYILSSIINLNYILANTISFTAGLLCNFYLSCKWVFNKESKYPLKDFIIFSLIGVIGLLLSNLILVLLLRSYVFRSMFLFEQTNLSEVVAKGISIVIVLIWNFTIRKIIIFDRI